VRLRRGRLVAGAAAAALVATLGSTSPAAAARGVPLPIPLTPLTVEPPLQTRVALTFAETRFPGRVVNREEVQVDLDPSGEPLAVRVLQRLTVLGTGDYAFVVPAPLLDVRPGPGTESEPGARRGQIVWQGFSPGRRMLAALVELRPAPALRHLPLRIRLQQRRDPQTGRFEVRAHVANATGARGSMWVAPVRRAELLRAIERLHRAARRGQPPAEVVLHPRRSLRTRTIAVAAPLRVEGRLVLRGARVRVESGQRSLSFSRLLRAPERMDFELVVRGSADRLDTARLAVTARPVQPLDELRRPSGDLLTLAARANLSYGRFRQYSTFLATPDVLTPSRTTYTFRTVAAKAAAPPGRTGDEGVGAWPYLVAAILGTGATAGLLVLWAHL
jgi:hypothetical protein